MPTVAPEWIRLASIMVGSARAVTIFSETLAAIAATSLEAGRQAGRLKNSIRNRGGIRRFGHIVQQDGKLVAAEPRNHVGRTNFRLKPSRHRPKQFVADGMTKCVIDVLEMIEIEIQDREAGIVSLRSRDPPLERLDKHLTIHQSGQVVIVRHPRDLLVRAFPFGDVAYGGIEQ